MPEHVLVGRREGAAIVTEMVQRQGTIAAYVDVHDLDVRLAFAQRILLGERRAQGTIAGIVVDRAHLEVSLGVVVDEAEKPEITHDLGRKKLLDEALVLEVAHCEVERAHPPRACEVGKPPAILGCGRFANALDVAIHRETERVGIDAAEVRIVETRLREHIRVRMQDLEEEAVGEEAFVKQRLQNRVVPERGPALVHYLRLALRVEVLGQLADDARDLALPWFKQRGVLLEEIEEILLRLGRKAMLFRFRALGLAPGQRTPQLVHLLLQMLLALLEPEPLLRKRSLRRAFVAVHTEVGQRMAGVKRPLHFFFAVPALAVGQVLAREEEIVDDRVRLRPGAKEVVSLEE